MFHGVLKLVFSFPLIINKFGVLSRIEIRVFLANRSTPKTPIYPIYGKVTKFEKNGN